MTSDPDRPARIYLAITAVYHFVLGGIGLLYNSAFPIGAEETRSAGSGLIFGIFETNGWHNAAALGLGFIALYFLFVAPRDQAILGALLVGVPNGFVALAFALEDPTTFWFASNFADNVIHTATAVGGVVTALWSAARRRRPAGAEYALER